MKEMYKWRYGGRGNDERNERIGWWRKEEVRRR